MNTKSKSRSILCALVFTVGLFASVDSFAWHGGWHHGGWHHAGWHHGWGHGWGHGYGWRHGYGWGGIGYVGYYGGGCRWVGAHWNRWGAWVPAHRRCW